MVSERRGGPRLRKKILEIPGSTEDPVHNSPLICREAWIFRGKVKITGPGGEFAGLTGLAGLVRLPVRKDHGEKGLGGEFGAR